MADQFSTTTLLGVVSGLLVPQPMLLRRFFPSVAESTAEEIAFDVLDKRRRIAPFVSPVIEGKIVESQGFTTKLFKPAYIKDKRIFNPSKALKRTPGEQIGGSLSPEERMNAILAQDLTEQVEMIERRLEVMASEALRTGKVTVVGDGYPSVVVDFGRDAALSPAALTSTARWGQSASDVATNLQTWAMLVLQLSGVAAVDLILGTDAWIGFRKDAYVKSNLDTRNVIGNALNTGAQLEEGLTFRGTLDGFNIWTYGGWYVDPADDTEKPIFPAAGCLMTGPGMEGVQAFGAIQDVDVGLIATRYVPKSWTQPDPSRRFLMMQSAPLVVPTRVNAALYTTVV